MTQSDSAEDAISAWLSSSAPDEPRTDALFTLIDRLINTTILTVRRASEAEREQLAATMAPLRAALAQWPPVAALPPFGALLGCLQALLRSHTPPIEQLDEDLRQKFARIETLAHTSDEEVRLRTVARNYAQAEHALLMALEQASIPQREALALQFEQSAREAVQGEPEGSPWYGLAEFLRAAAVILRNGAVDRRTLGMESRRRLERVLAQTSRASQHEIGHEELPASVLYALMNNSAEELDAALAALPPEQCEQVIATLEHQLHEQMNSLSEEEQRAVAREAQRGQIAAATEQACAMARRALHTGTLAARIDLAAQISSEAARAAAGEPSDSPWVELKAFLDAIAALLRGEPVPPVPLAYTNHLARIQNVA